MMRKIIIIGAGGHAVSVANVAISAGYEIAGFVDANRAGSKLLNYQIMGGIESVGDPLDFIFSIAIGDNFQRSKVFYDLTRLYPGIYFPTLVHSTAVVSHFSTLEMGSVLMPLSLVGPNTNIGKFCILNSNSSIDHDGRMGEFASLAPGVVLGGSVNIGNRSVIAIGSVVKHSLQVGSDSILGAYSYLNKNLEDGCIAYGAPAKVVRKRESGDSYL